MSMLKELGISDIGDNLRGFTSSTNMHHKNFNISCGCDAADQMLSNEMKNDLENKGGEEDDNTLGYVRVVHNYLPQEMIVPSFEPYRIQEINYDDEFDITKQNRFLTYEDKKKAYNGEEDHIFCGRFPHLSDCGCKYPCSLILPKIHPIQIDENIYVGPLESVFKTKELLFLKIKNILNVSCVSYNKRIKYFKYYDIFINDNHTENAIKYFKITNRFIDDAVNSGGKILIHCKLGISRSAAIIIAYLIKYYGFNFNSALKFIKKQRDRINPNAGFIELLKQYEKKSK